MIKKNITMLNCTNNGINKEVKFNVEFQELDRKKKIKRIIAREGLISLVVVIIGSLIFWFDFLGGRLSGEFIQTGQNIGNSRVFVLEFFQVWGKHIFFALLLFYLAYCPIRFILWAIKILKK